MKYRRAAMVLLMVGISACGGGSGESDTAQDATRTDRATTTGDDDDDDATSTSAAPSEGEAAEGRCALADERPLQLSGSFSPAVNTRSGQSPPETAPYEPNFIELTENVDGTFAGKWGQLSVTTELTGSIDTARRRITGKTVPSPFEFEDDLGRVVEVSGFTAELNLDTCAFVGRFQDPDTGTFGGGVLEVPDRPDFIVRIGGGFELRAD